MTPTLWHYACHHSWLAIGDAGALLPPRWLLAQHRIPMPTTVSRPRYGRAVMERWERPLLDLIWATDLDTPDPVALGLTRDWIRCDRTAYRYRVTDLRFMEPWTQVTGIPKRLREELEAHPLGVQPAHWWVASVPVAVILDPRP